MWCNRPETGIGRRVVKVYLNNAMRLPGMSKVTCFLYCRLIEKIRESSGESIRDEFAVVLTG